MNNPSNLEQKKAPHLHIVPPKEKSPSSQNLSTVDTETSEATSLAIQTQNKIWSGRVSLDPHKYDSKPTDPGRINSSIATGATDIDEEELIKAITSGQSWSPTVFNGKRDREHFVEMNALVVDFDEGFETLDEILTRAEKHDLTFSFVHESFSHTPERPKYRGIFLLSKPIQNYDEAKFYCDFIKDVFKDLVDRGAAEPCRLYYGGRAGSVVIHNQGWQYDLDWLKNASQPFRLTYGNHQRSQANSSQKASKKSQSKSNQPSPVSSCHTKIDYQIDFESFSEGNQYWLKHILACLELIPQSDCDAESSWFKITCALRYESLINPELEKEIEAIWDKWSSSSSRYNRQNNHYRWNSLNDISDNAITLGTVITKYCGGRNAVDYKMGELFPECFVVNCSPGQKQETNTAKPQIDYKDKSININTRMFTYIESQLLARLWFNLHTQNFEIDGQECRNVDFTRKLSDALNYAVTQSLFAQVIEKYQQDRSYHPFEKYLKTLWDTETKPSENDLAWANSIMSKLVTDIMKIEDDEFAITLVKKWLVGLVSRVFTPGIKFDHVLTLVGGKGLGKTSFFERITGEAYYVPHTGSLNNKDTLMKLHKKIVVELGEVEAVFRKTDIEEMKCFITTREDDYRIPYASQPLSHKRRFVLGASANSSNFLKEPDGNRRFWIVTITEKIDFKRIETMRSEIFRAACILRAAGETIYLSDAETALNNDRNHQHVDLPLLEEIESILANQSSGNSAFGKKFQQPFLTEDIAAVLSSSFPHVNPNPRAINNVLKHLNYTQKRTTYAGKNGRFWVKENGS